MLIAGIGQQGVGAKGKGAVCGYHAVHGFYAIFQCCAFPAWSAEVNETGTTSCAD